MATKVKESGASPPAKRIRILAKGVVIAYAPGVYTASAFEAGAQEKFSASFVMLPDNPAIKATEQAIIDVIDARWPDKASRPKRIRGVHFDPVLKLCDDYKSMGIKTKGCVFVRAYSSDAPIVVDASRKELIGADLRKECYSGRPANASFTIYTYDRKPFPGVTAGIGNIQLLGHGERLGAPRPAPEEEFDKEELPETDNDDGDDDDLAPARRPRRR